MSLKEHWRRMTEHEQVTVTGILILVVLMAVGVCIKIVREEYVPNQLRGNIPDYVLCVTKTTNYYPTNTCHKEETK
jgi:hypothetical protein